MDAKASWLAMANEEDHFPARMLEISVNLKNRLAGAVWFAGWENGQCVSNGFRVSWTQPVFLTGFRSFLRTLDDRGKNRRSGNRVRHRPIASELNLACRPGRSSGTVLNKLVHDKS
ncbi:hypothetical protein J8N05_36355 [Streptomyces sp. BH-SS-21]|uniref:Uncharacterized protein n=1 Tax=Streptomyces liliiviolaceus TaxID=2823109 RepID=A0A940Y315_9ACTN|nr:hypothetical protein [Streptomyces liliiviolaceus]MBQ0853638.1 hypothetical protein [Streptomyces liliiviolaceus]